MILSSPPQFGQRSRSIWNTRLSNRAQLIRTGLKCAQPGSVAVCSDLRVSCAGPCGTTNARSLALGASTPWKRIRCYRDRGTIAARRCMNSSGLITMWVVPSRQAVLSWSTTCPAVLICTRSLASAPTTLSTRCAAVCAMRRAPHEGLQASALATEGDQFVVAAIDAAQAQEAVRQDAALQESVELVFGELRQAGTGGRLSGIQQVA